MLKEHTEKLAKLMAGEDIDVIQMNAPSAFFDLEIRQLVIPNWKSLSVAEEEMLVGHEIGHALHTPLKEWKETIDNFDGNKVVIRHVLNVVEDARIERLVKQKYPGMRSIFYRGYEELFSRGVFKLEESKPEETTILEHLNWHYKIPGKTSFVKTPEFDYFVGKIDSVVTFDDVVDVSKELYAFCKQELDKELSESSSENQEAGEGSQGSGGKNREISEENWNQEESPKPDNGDGEGLTEKKFEEGLTEKKFGEGLTEKKFEEKYGSNSLEQKKEEFLKQQADTSYYKERQTLFIPEVDVEKVIVSYKEVLKGIEKYPKKLSAKSPTSSEEDRSSEEEDPIHFEIDSSVKKFNKNRKSTVDYYSKIFEMRKKASEYQKTLNFRTGKLDMDRIHNYKFEDNLFLNGQIKFKGKNHGLVVFLDMSSSMGGVFRNCLTQLLELVLFCRNSGIALSVYGFSNVSFVISTKNFRTAINFGKHNPIDIIPFSLIELFSPKMSTKEFNAMFQNIVSGGFGRSLYFTLGGTPLSLACLCVEGLVKKMRKENGSEIVNIIFLTDGGDTDGYGFWSRNGFLQDPKTKMKISYENVRNSVEKSDVFKDYSYSYEVPAAILELMKKRVNGINIVNFFINKSMRDLVLTDKASGKMMGFDRNYIIDPESFTVNKLNLDRASNSEEVHNSFLSSKKGTQQKQTMIRDFINQIC
jgi:hypothetical protein